MRGVIGVSQLLLLLFLSASASAQNTVHFFIDAQQDVHPISRFIYGVNQPIGEEWTHATFERFGGNRTTEYNWITNASNAGRDWHSISDDYFSGKTPGAPVAALLRNAFDNNAGALITVPINGYVAADEKGDDVRMSGPNYLQTRFHRELPAKGSAFTLTPDPNSPVVYQDEFVNWVKVNFPYGQTDANRPIWFTLDNEPDIWAESHPEAHPKKVTYEELIEKTIPYATAIKNVEPNAMVFGPANFGWNGYVSLQDAADSEGRDFEEFYLGQMAQASAKAGKRLLDGLDLHYYTEAMGGGVRVTTQDSTPAIVAARLQSPRSLWDPDFMETSWITNKTGIPIDLIPELQDKIARNFPGTKLGFGEYNFGGGNSISGAIAEADVLGIFGRFGVFSANEWPGVPKEPYIAGGFAMFRDFDGKNGSFGDTSASAITDDVPDTSIYASVDSGNPDRMVLIALNKTNHAIRAAVQLRQLKNGAPYRFAAIYRLTSKSPKPSKASLMSVSDPGNFSFEMPAYSVNTINLVTQ